uniref:CUB domain-containing protein n=1 Tax=Schizaphis graminum TaxID=13262 RepID=A0A2S2PE94_SCHGA
MNKLFNIFLIIFRAKTFQVPTYGFMYTIRTRSKKVQVFSIHFGVEISYTNPNCSYTSRTESSEIDGLICKTNFISGIRYSLQCGDIKLRLRPVDEDGNLEFEYKCKP